MLMCQLSSRASFRGAAAKRRRARNPYSLTCGYRFQALGLRPSPGMTGQGFFPERALPVRGKASLASFRRLLEEAQVRRRLVLAGRHQVAVSGPEVTLSLDHHVAVALGTVFLGPFRLFLRIAAILFDHGPGPRQRLVDGRHLVDHHVW